MRVLMVNHPEARDFRGGDLIQMRQTAAALKPLGVDVAESFLPNPDASGFDLAHVFNLRTVGVVPGQLAHLKKLGIPIVLTPIYVDPGVALWGSRAVLGAFQDAPPPALLAERLARIVDRTMRVHQSDQPTMEAHTPNRPQPNYDRLQRQALQLVDLVLANSTLEVHCLRNTLRMPHVPFAIAPVGVDADFFSGANPNLFATKYGLRDFVLQVGRIELLKNQLMLAHAIRESGLKLVIIGSCRQMHYLELVRQYGPRDLTVIGHLSPEEIRSAYAAARVHVLPSWSETCGLVNLEAALGDCSIVAGCLGYEVEYLSDLVEYCDPADAESIRNAVVRAWENHATSSGRREQLKLRIIERFTWHECARATLAAYHRVLTRR